MPYQDSEFKCTTDADSLRYVKDLHVDVHSFGGVELCDSLRDSKKLFNVMELIEKGRFAVTLNNPLIQGFIPASDYYTWLVQQTRGVERRNDLPYATAHTYTLDAS